MVDEEEEEEEEEEEDVDAGLLVSEEARVEVLVEAVLVGGGNRGNGGDEVCDVPDVDNDLADGIATIKVGRGPSPPIANGYWGLGPTR